MKKWVSKKESGFSVKTIHHLKTSRTMTLCIALFLLWIKQKSWYESILILTILFIFTILTQLFLYSETIQEELFPFIGLHGRNLLWSCIIGNITLCLTCLLPVNYFLFFSLIIFFVSMTRLDVALSLCYFFLFLSASLANMNRTMLSTYGLVVIFGAFLGALTKKTRKTGVYYLLVFMCNFLILAMVEVIASFLVDQQQGISFHFLELFLYSVLYTFLLWFAFYIWEKNDLTRDGYLAKLMAPDFLLLQEFKTYFPAEYLHCKKVSVLSKKYAIELGLDERLCETAGMYYEIGILEGEIGGKTNEILAKKYSFPSVLTKILKEYYGEFQLISTRESAIVHIVDTCVRGQLYQHHGNTTDDIESHMALYQTINTLSKNGIYDQSGLGMNQFLQIRDLIVKEDFS